MVLSRRSHRKSRLGCKRCKARRMKCDEVHPICGHCAKHSMACDFTPSNNVHPAEPLQPVEIPPLQQIIKPRVLSASSSTSGSSVRSSSQSASPTSWSSSSTELVSRSASNGTAEPTKYVTLNQISSPADHLLQLRLFHHYLEATAPYSVEKGRNAWTNWITGLAFKTPSLMDVLLGFSAFHLRYREPSDKAVREASHRYMARGIIAHSKQMLEGVNADNAEVLFATSMFIAFHAASSQIFLTGSKHDTTLMHWFRPWKGIRAVLAAGWQYIQNAEIRKIVQYEQLAEFDLVSTGEVRSLQTQQKFYFLLEGMDKEDLDQETIGAYESSVACLSKIYSMPIHRHVFKFTALVSQRFVQLVAAQDPRALTITGYYFMLLKRLDNVWWLQGAADREFHQLMNALPEEWKPRMEWAVREFDGRVDPKDFPQGLDVRIIEEVA